MIASRQNQTPPLPERSADRCTAWRDTTRKQCEQRIDEELDDSFPASDPPSWVHGTASIPH